MKYRNNSISLNFIGIHSLFNIFFEALRHMTFCLIAQRVVGKFRAPMSHRLFRYMYKECWQYTEINKWAGQKILAKVVK